MPNLYALFGGLQGRESPQGEHHSTFGDLYLFDTSNCYWSRPKIGGMMPSPRMHASLVGNQMKTEN